MKKEYKILAVLMFFTLIYTNVNAQYQQVPVIVADSTVVFGRTWPANQVFLNLYDGKYYKITVKALATNKLSNISNTQVAGNFYTSGTGITLSGSTFSHTAHTGDATGATSLTVVALRGRSILTTTPTTGNVLTYDGSNWYPLAPTGNSYEAGTGITLTSNTFSLSFLANNSNSIYLAGSYDKLGIGTTLPTQQLEITGSFKIPATSNSATGIIFQGDTSSFHTYGIRNRFMGSGAGNFTLTGNDNYAYGYRALKALTTGVGCVAIGSYSLQANTTGAYNVAIGPNAMKANIANNYNVAVGPDALLSLKDQATGYNTAVGYGAGKTLNPTSGANGQKNTAIGYLALVSSATGYDNTCVGYWAGVNVPSNDNTAVGSRALSGTAGTGGQNTAIGKSALYGTIGTGNTALGYNAALANISGTENVAIGETSFQGNTTGSYNTHIGIGTSNAAVNQNWTIAVGANSYATGRGQVIIGNSMYNTRLQTDKFNIGIGNTNPYAVTVNTRSGYLQWMLIGQYDNTMLSWGSFGFDSLTFFDTRNAALVQYKTSLTGVTMTDDDSITIYRQPFASGGGVYIYAHSNGVTGSRRIKTSINY